MKKQPMLTLLKDMWNSDYSDTAVAVAESSIDSWDTMEEAIDNLSFEIDRFIIYYSDAFNYLMDNNITDFEEAIDNGAKDITSIACFYLYEETLQLLFDLDNLTAGE